MRRWPAICLLLAAVVWLTACGRRIKEQSARANQRCDDFVAALTTEALPKIHAATAAVPGLRFAAYELAFRPQDTHYTPQSCRAVAAMPEDWEYSLVTRDLSGMADGVMLWRDVAGKRLGSFRIELVWEPVAAVGAELAAARRGGVVVRDEWSDRGAVIVTREQDAVHMLAVRRHLSSSYIRCEAHLAPEYARALPAFEVACATAQVLDWRYPDR